jgi:hypothetical protein
MQIKKELHSGCWIEQRMISVPNSFHIFEQYLLAAAVIKLRGPAVGVTGNALGSLQSAVIFQKIRDAGRPE